MDYVMDQAQSDALDISIREKYKVKEKPIIKIEISGERRSGKSTIAKIIQAKLQAKGFNDIVINDGEYSLIKDEWINDIVTSIKDNKIIISTKTINKECK
jgi:adenylylsulfate kinase-like enzyme